MFGKKGKQHGPQGNLAQLSLQQGRGQSLFAGEVNPPPPEIDFGFERFYSQAEPNSSYPEDTSAGSISETSMSAVSMPEVFMPESEPASEGGPQWDQPAADYTPEAAYTSPVPEPSPALENPDFTFEPAEAIQQDVQELSDFILPAPGMEGFDLPAPAMENGDTSMGEPMHSLDYLPGSPEEEVSMGSPPVDLWSQLSSATSDVSGSGLQMPVTEETPGQFLDTVNQQLYPETVLDPMAFEASAQAFEEAAEMLFPETISGSPMLENSLDGEYANTPAWSTDATLADPSGLSLGPSFQAGEQAELYELSPTLEQEGPELMFDSMPDPAAMEPSAYPQGPDEMFLPDTYFTPPAGESVAAPMSSFDQLAGTMSQPGEDTGWESPVVPQDHLSDLQGDPTGSTETGTPDSAWEMLPPVDGDITFLQEKEAPVYSLGEEATGTEQPADSSFSWETLQGPPEPLVDAISLNPVEHLASEPVSSPETDPSQWRVEDLQVLGVCPLDESKNIVVVQHEQTTALMAQTGDPANPQIYVMKLFQQNPLQQDPELVASREAKLGTKELYRVKIGAWQGIVSADNEVVALHTELS